MLSKSLADRYANALFAAALEQNAAEALSRELLAIKETVEAAPALRRVLFHPAISAVEKQAVTQDLLGRQISAIALRFLSVLFEAKRIQYLGLIADSFDLLHRRSVGRLSVRAVSARPVADDVLRRIGSALEARLGKEVDVTGVIDDRLVGGVRLVFEDHNVIDGSIAYRLDALRERIVTG